MKECNIKPKVSYLARVESESTPGTFYNVSYYPKEDIGFCECSGWRGKQNKCYHLDAVRKLFNEGVLKKNKYRLFTKKQIIGLCGESVGYSMEGKTGEFLKKLRKLFIK